MKFILSITLCLGLLFTIGCYDSPDTEYYENTYVQSKYKPVKNYKSLIEHRQRSVISKQISEIGNDQYDQGEKIIELLESIDSRLERLERELEDNNEA